MELYNNQEIDIEKLKVIQSSFENAVKILEQNIAESITNKQKLNAIEQDLIDANKKFNESQTYLEDLKLKLKNKIK
ncbi:MAG: hypothetical protein O2916_07645 [Proteobacteria bacterium]|jgi:hypothetical protein|nr:hypothetical protein [Pseudomonadota bacterium]|tara:strand:- start:532 stop:759 length:228 start_codon:yes stop_codon:yes gene_type:complete